MVSKKIVNEIMDSIAPLKLAMEWDNCGLIVDANDEYSGILVCLDVTKKIIDEAIEKGCNLIVSHHPALFSKINKISKDDVVFYAVSKKVSIYSAHTNMDLAENGLNQKLAEDMGLKNISSFEDLSFHDYKKIVVYAPSMEAEKIKASLSSAGAGMIGEYSECMYESKGVGSFRPSDRANPSVGKKGKLERVEETRIECICPVDRVSDAILLVKQAHSYEEPAIDVIPLEYPNFDVSLGRIGFLEKQLTIEEFVNIVKKNLCIEGVRVCGDLKRKIKKVAVCCGSGGDMICAAKAKGADMLFTGEAKHNHYIDAVNSDIVLVEAGHYNTEKQFMEIVIRSLQEAFDSIQCNVAVAPAKAEECPYEVI